MSAVTEKMTNLEWLTQIGLKAIEYTEDPKGTGEKGPSWEDRCGAIASIECQHAKHTVNCWFGVIIGIIRRHLLRSASTLQKSFIPQQKKR